ncbi:MAG: hypothetical protein KC978_14920, partial [Candidatus Omnitrophica bacterium]|nr:hypothetical protein [Candidatus Omnitrophota bacterium]
IELGQRILKFSIDALEGAEWKTIAEGTSVGWKRILKIDPVTAGKVRLNVLESKACPTVSTLSLYASPEAQMD